MTDTTTSLDINTLLDDDFVARRRELMELLEGVRNVAEESILHTIGDFVRGQINNLLQVDRLPASGAGSVTIRVGFSPVFERLVSALRASRVDDFRHIDLSSVA